ncbi:MAG: TerB family tellurite resistance protein, partial [Butyrivibrio sp.]|nr:TerB family tellurite resistance protein [Butyrivibrio sp.]
LEMGINNNGYQKERTLDEVTELINSDMSEEERKIIYIELLTVAYIDQEFSSEERKLVDRVQDILKISKEDAEEAEEIVENLIVYVKKLEGFVETYSKKIEDYIS